MPTLILNLVGPQSWGMSSYFKQRDTGMEPSKSGVYGLIEAALGLDRKETYPPLAGLRFGVRVDRPGQWEVDFQTAQSVAMANGEGHKNEVLRKAYLADAHFMVALEGDQAILEIIQEALLRPKRPIHLGRRAFSPLCPLILPDSLQSEPMKTTLTTYPWCAGHLFAWPFHPPGQPLRVVMDDENGYEIRHDQRIGSPASHEYTRRRVRTAWVKPVLASPAVAVTALPTRNGTRLVSVPTSMAQAQAAEKTPEAGIPAEASTRLYESRVIFENPTFDPRDMNSVHRIVLDALNVKGGQPKLPLLFRLDQGERDTFKLVVRCSRPPDWSRIDQFQVVEVVSGPFRVPNLTSGNRFRFGVLVNPTQKSSGKKSGLIKTRQQLDWFRQKAAQRGGFQIVQITHHLQKPQVVKRDGQEMTFIGALFEGIGQVVDEALFEKSLEEGLAASGKFAGFNMLQILQYPV